jgi:hypothetical protein
MSVNLYIKSFFNNGGQTTCPIDASQKRCECTWVNKFCLWEAIPIEWIASH